MKIYLTTCDKTSYILPLTIYLYKKFVYIPFEIIILGFSKPNLSDWENVHFISLAPKQENIYLWSKYLYNYFKNIDDDIVWLSLDDFLPISNININCYKEVLKYMKNNKIGLCTISQTIYSDSKDYKPPGKCFAGENFYIYERNKKDDYNISLQPGLWKREYLCKIFNNNYSPWDVEIKGTKISHKLNYINLGTCEKPESDITSLMEYSYVSSLSSKWEPYINLQGFSLKLINEIINKKLIEEKLITIGCPMKKIKYKKEYNREFYIKLHSDSRDDKFFKKFYL